MKGTKCKKLIYKKVNEMEIVSNSDADWAWKVDSRKSTSGFCLLLNETSGAINWISKLQSTVATSTAEAEAAASFRSNTRIDFS